MLEMCSGITINHIALFALLYFHFSSTHSFGLKSCVRGWGKEMGWFINSVNVGKQSKDDFLIKKEK